MRAPSPAVVLGLAIAATLAGCAAAPDAIAVRLEDAVATVTVDGKAFATVHTGAEPRPFVFPLIGSDGIAVTRPFPMVESPGEQKDHPHHVSLWFAHGDVGGFDFWQGAKNKERIALAGGPIAAVEQGAACVRASYRWLAGDDTLVCTEDRLYRFGVHDGARTVDVDVTLRPTDRALVLGDTKEGTFAVRVRQALCVDGEGAAGRLFDSEGRRDGAVWGKRARWIDDVGTIEGREVGVAMFDHPANHGHPTWWHARTYGLLAANPFGVHDFEKRPPGTGALTVQPNAGEARSAAMTVAGVAITITQAAPPCAVTAEASASNFDHSGGRGFVRVFSNRAGCLWTVANLPAWISTVVTGGTGGGQSFDFTVAPNAGLARSATFLVGQSSITLSQSGSPASASGLRFVALPPCRMVDTRTGGGKTGAFGPPMLASAQSRTIPVPTSGCGVPASALAYAINVTVVPIGALGYLTVWPAGQPQPFVSTLNAFQGEVVANAAIVPAGVGGAVDVYASNPTHLIVDINGYFTDQPVADLLFYPVAACRVIDTRAGQGMPPGLGPPSFDAASQRSFALASGRCGIPARARAYSLNLTVVPHEPLAYISAWPTGQTRPLVSVLNSFDGRVAANAAIVPAGLGAAIDIYASNRTDVIADINGYFAPDDGRGHYFFPANPCRAVDTRPGQGTVGEFGPPSMLAGEARVFPLPLSRCGLPASAAAWSANVTVVPAGVLSYLSMGPDGAPVPFVSTLNSFDGRVVANAAITAAGASGGIQVYTTDRTDVILDLNGWFRR